jgi:hypothetical protein
MILLPIISSEEILLPAITLGRGRGAAAAAAAPPPAAWGWGIGLSQEKVVKL